MSTPRRCDLVVRGDFVLPMTDGLPQLAGAVVAVKDGSIVAVGSRAEIDEDWRADDEIAGGIVLPGLVNCHGHAAMTLYRGLCDDLPLKRWLEDFVWPAERKFTTPQNVEIGTRLAVAEMFASGTTTFADMYFFEEVVGKVCADAGMRVLLGQAVLDFPTPDAPSSGASFKKCTELAASWKGHPLVRVSMALHAVYTVPPQQLAYGAQEAARLGIPIQIHMSETAGEVTDCVAKHGVRPPALLARTGVLRDGTVCAHGLHVDDEDLRLVREAKAGISLNPESNLKLASGVPDVARYLEAGIRVGLGTDGAASNDDLDLWDAVRLAALLAKGIRNDPTVVPAREAVRIATRGGAEVLGLAGVVGTLEPGRRADLCVIDTESAHLTPLYDPWSPLAYAVRGSDVVHTVVEGRVVYRDRRHTTIDLPAARAAAAAVARDIAQSVRQSR